MNGIVKSVNRDKLFGFIEAGSGPQYFFHRSGLKDDYAWESIQKAVSSGYQVKVSFTPIQTSKGPRAEDVSLMGDENE